MHPLVRRSVPGRPAPALLAVAVLALATALAACGGGTAAPSFDPSSPCTAAGGDGRAPGAYPELEALLPAAVDGAAPGSVDSGRSCTAEALGTLADDGLAAVTYAGATWDLGGGRGLTVALFEGAGIAPDALLRFYETGAQAARRTETLATSAVTVATPGGERAGARLDVLGTNGATQSIAIWPSGTGERAWVLLTADLGDTRFLELLTDLAASLP